jgi:hypothetical protein
MKKRAAAKRHPSPKKKNKMGVREKGYWHFDHIVQDATEGKMDRIWDAFIDAVEGEGLVCTGTFHPAGGCPRCKGISDE